MGRLLRDARDRRIVGLAVPALGSLAVEPIYVLVDTAIVGRLGTVPLGGLAIAATVLMVAISLTNFTEYAITTDVAHAHGAAHAATARRAATNALWLAGALGVLTAAVVAVCARPFAYAAGGRGDVLAAAVTYLRIAAIGVPGVLLVAAGQGILRGLNRPGRPLVVLAVANALNVVLEIVFVYRFHWGVAGSAWSTTLVQLLAAVWMLVLLGPHVGRTLPERSPIAAQLQRGRRLVSRVAAMLAVWLSTTVIAARVDDATLGANQIATELFLFLALVVDAYAIPAQSLVAGAIGSGDLDEATAVGRACERLSLLTAAAIAGALLAGSVAIPHAFTRDPAVVARATAALVLLAAMQLPGAIAFAYDGALIGADDTVFLARQAWRNLVAFAPLAVATWVHPGLGIAGLWGAQLAWMTLRAHVNRTRFRSRAWAVATRSNVTSPRGGATGQTGHDAQRT